MADQSATLYPGDTLTITVSTGQAAEGDPIDPAAEPDDAEPTADPSAVVPNGTPEVEPITVNADGTIVEGPAAGTVPSPVEFG